MIMNSKNTKVHMMIYKKFNAIFYYIPAKLWIMILKEPLKAIKKKH